VHGPAADLRPSRKKPACIGPFTSPRGGLTAPRPQPGPGPGKLTPAWAQSGPLIPARSEPFMRIRRSRVDFGRSKRVGCRPLTLESSFSFPPHPSLAPHREEPAAPPAGHGGRRYR
jgi:hypothetical protein